MIDYTEETGSDNADPDMEYRANANPITNAIDIYSLGKVMRDLMSLKFELSHYVLDDNDNNIQLELGSGPRQRYPPVLCNLVQQCLRKKFDDRPSLNDLRTAIDAEIMSGGNMRTGANPGNEDLYFKSEDYKLRSVMPAVP